MYHNGDKKYYPFVRSEDKRTNKESGKTKLLNFKEHHDTFKKVIKYIEENELLFLDKHKGSMYANKSIRMNTEVYEKLSSFCEEYHLQFKNVGCHCTI